MRLRILTALVATFVSTAAFAGATAYQVIPFNKTFKRGKSENGAKLIKITGNPILVAWFDARNKEILASLSKIDRESDTNVFMQVNVQTENLFSVSETTDIYGHGAAHGNASSVTYNIIPSTGMQLPTNPFAKTNAKLDKIILEGIKKTTEDNHNFESLKKQPTTGWFPNKGKIAIYWTPYAVAPGAMADCQTDYSPDELKEFLLPEVYKAVKNN